MAKPKQRALLRRPNRLKAPKPLVLHRPTKDCAICSNLRNKINKDGVKYAVRCEHKGRTYTVNGGYIMTLCVCCARRINRVGVTIEAGIL